jgi:hypothetical protein
VGPTAGLDAVEKRTILRFWWESNPDSLAVKSAIPAPTNETILNKNDNLMFLQHASFSEVS